MIALVALEGVLRAPSGTPDYDMLNLVSLMSERWTVIMLLDKDEADAERWRIQQPHFAEKISNQISINVIRRSENLREDQLAYAKATYGPVAFVLDSDPVFIAYALSEGIPSLLWTHPRYSLDSNRPDPAMTISGPQPWGMLMDSIHGAWVDDEVAEDEPE